MAYRPERLAEAMKQELSELLHRLKDPRVGFVTVVSVEVTRDLRHAKIYTSVLGSKEEQKATMDALEGATGYLRSEIGRRIRLRHTPEIVFKLDHSISDGMRLVGIIEQVTEERSGEGQDD